MDNNIGKMVFALSGRDKGNCFIVMSQKGNILYLCDGKRRKVGNPKAKNIKHISFTNIVDKDLRELILTNKLTDKKVRKYLSDLKDDKSIISKN